MFKALHAAYVRLASNPFSDVERTGHITSAAFEAHVHSLVRHFDAVIARPST